MDFFLKPGPLDDELRIIVSPCNSKSKVVMFSMKSGIFIFLRSNGEISNGSAVFKGR